MIDGVLYIHMHEVVLKTFIRKKFAKLFRRVRFIFNFLKTIFFGKIILLFSPCNLGKVFSFFVIIQRV